MPYKAAKAVAATFCYKIRYALTPIFGKDFPSMCTHPTDPTFEKFLIDPAIVRECTDETNRWRTEGVTYKVPAAEQHTSIASSPTVSSVPSTPQLQFSCSPWGIKASLPQHEEPADRESGYGTPESMNEKYAFSPAVSPRSHAWTSINRPSSPVSLPTFSPPQGWLTAVPSGYGSEQLRPKRTLSKVTYSDDGEDVRPPTSASTATADVNADSLEDSEDGYYAKEAVDAADILLNFSAREVLHRTKRTRRGSKY